MLTKGLDRETEQFLAEILEQENTTTDELIRNLIRDRWLSLHQQTTEQLAEAVMQPMPSMNGVEQSEPEPGAVQQPMKQRSNKRVIADFIKKKRFH